MSGRRPPTSISPVVVALHRRAKQMEMSGYRLAKLTGLPLRTVQRFLAGSVSPTLSTVEVIAKALGMRVSAEDVG
jgi:DNA-binding phage protein